MNVFDQPKIDCDNHVPAAHRFPFAETFSTPSGPELSTVGQLLDVFYAYGVTHGLLVNPNSG